MNISVCIDPEGFKSKPNKSRIGIINQRIVKCKRECSLEEVAQIVGAKGHTFCPAVFNGTKRKSNEVSMIQLFCIDIDEGLSFEELEERCKKYGLPIAFAYHTFSSTEEKPKFRVAFLHEIPVTDHHVGQIIMNMLLAMFPEADKMCRDLSRMFFGGKGLIGTVSEDTFHIVQLAMMFQKYQYEKDSKHYSRNIEAFARDNNIQLIDNTLQIFYVEGTSDFGEKL